MFLLLDKTFLTAINTLSDTMEYSDDDMDFSVDNNPFAGSNHCFSSGIRSIDENNGSESERDNDSESESESDDDNDGNDNDNDDIDNTNITAIEEDTTTTATEITNISITTFEIIKDTVYYKIQNTNNNTHVLRRYNDFKSLRNYLCKFYPYLFIPPIPEKHSISRFFKNPFHYKNDISIIELRIRLLNYFIRRIINNKKLSISDIWCKFIDPYIDNWLSVLNSPPFTNLSTNSLLLIQTQNPTKPSPYFSFIPIPPLNLLKKFQNELNDEVFKNLENILKIIHKISINLESKIKDIIHCLNGLRGNMVELGGFLNIFSILENQNINIENFGNKIDLNFLNIEVLINNLIILFKEPLIIIKNSISYMLQMLHFRKLKELQLIYFKNIILQKQMKLKSLIKKLNPIDPIPINKKSSSPSINLAISNMNNQSTISISRSPEAKKLLINEIKLLNNELNNLLPCFKLLNNDVKFLSINVERSVNNEFTEILNLFSNVMNNWAGTEYGDYLKKCTEVWSK